MSKVADISLLFGTITDKTKITAEKAIEAPCLTMRDLAMFKRIVSTGAISDKQFRPPAGHKVYGFMMALKNAQELELARIILNEREELEKSYEKLWLKLLERHQGNTKAATDNFLQLWGGTSPTEETKQIFNTSYKSALLKWRQQNTKGGSTK